MIQRVLASKSLVAYVLACVTGLTLYFRWPFPEDDLMLHLIALRAPNIYAFFNYSYTLFLFTPPFIACSVILSGVYIFAFRPTRKLNPRALPQYPAPGKRQELCLVIRGGPRSAKARSCRESLLADGLRGRSLYRHCHSGRHRHGQDQRLHLPLHEQLIAYQAHNAEYRYNPLYNDLDAYELAYNIASLLNNLFGKGKEPFWQQAYTNLVKFIIHLHKVAYEYVTAGVR